MQAGPENDDGEKEKKTKRKDAAETGNSSGYDSRNILCIGAMSRDI